MIMTGLKLNKDQYLMKMAKQHLNIDDAEDYGDGTQAQINFDNESNYSDESYDEIRVNSTKKQEKAPSLRIQNWTPNLIDSQEYAGKVIKRKEMKQDLIRNESSEMGSDQEMNDWSEGEPFGSSDSSENEEPEDFDHEENPIAPLEDQTDSDSEDYDNNEDAISDLANEKSTRLMQARDNQKLFDRAKAVRQQKIIWERALEIQIYTKRMLTTMQSSTNIDKNDDEKKKLMDTMYNCIQIISGIQNQFCNIPELQYDSEDMTQHGMKKRKRVDNANDLWTEIKVKNDTILPQYSEILNTLTRQTSLTSSGPTKKQSLPGTKFKAVNQDILTQVDSVLSDPQRVKRKAHAPIQSNNDKEDDDQIQLDELNYDDTSFYQQLLKEFIESGSGGGDNVGNFAQLQRTKRKKKTVNRKASKGRELRFTVHPKLENFMFPEPYSQPHLDTDEVFRSLFH